MSSLPLPLSGKTYTQLENWEMNLQNPAAQLKWQTCLSRKGMSTCSWVSDPSKSCRLDDLLKEGAAQLAGPLTMLLSRSLSFGALPQDWISANVTPIYKKLGNKHLVSNYRLVSFTCIAVKLLEHLVYNQLTTSNDKLYRHHSMGFELATPARPNYLKQYTSTMPNPPM